MARWRHALDWSLNWSKAREGEITTEELAAFVVRELRNFGTELADDERKDELLDVIQQFESLLDDQPSIAEDEFDEVMCQLYDWADTPLDNEWPPAKICWIKTF